MRDQRSETTTKENRMADQPYRVTAITATGTDSVTTGPISAADAKILEARVNAIADRNGGNRVTVTPVATR